VGTACVTKFSVDSTWYRSEIIEATDDGCVIRFVDFGNTQKCSFDELKWMKLSYGDLPALANHIKLDGVIAQVRPMFGLPWNNVLYILGFYMYSWLTIPPMTSFWK